MLDFERGVNDWSQWTNGKKDIFGKAAAATGAMAAQLLGASPDETNRWGHRPQTPPLPLYPLTLKTSRQEGHS